MAGGGVEMTYPSDFTFYESVNNDYMAGVLPSAVFYPSSFISRYE